jgi:uncharacterized membrane protein
MEWATEWLPGEVQWVLGLAALVLLAVAVRLAPWHRLRDSQQLHVFLGACVAVLVLWNMRAGVMPGLDFHVLGVTALTLMFGPALTLIAVALVLAGTALNGAMAWEAVGTGFWALGVVPVASTLALLRLAQRVLPANYFVYVFVNAFFAAGVGSVLANLSLAGILLAGGVYDLAQLSYLFLPYIPMMFFGEAFLNGILLAIFVAYRPGWVESFNDAFYLYGKSRNQPH